MNRIQGCNIFLLLADGKSPQHLGANNNKEVNSVRKADKPNIVINVNVNVYGDNNKATINETRSQIPAVVLSVIGVSLIAAAVLAVFFCCPDQLPDFVRSIIGEVINS